MAKRVPPTTISTGGNNGSLKVAGKGKPESGRSHKENQERAFIAASRRSDRSLEARVQSARAASNIHRERTGRGFKITEEIVLAEEMYEEEEDDLPRPYRALAAAAIASGSPLMDNRVSAYVTSRIAMADAQAELYAEVDRKFAEHFGPVIPPRHAAQPIYYTPCYTYMPNHLPQAPQQHAPLPSSPLAIQRDRAHSVAQIPPFATTPSRFHSQGQATRHASLDERIPTPALSPGSTQTLTPSSSATPQYYPEDLRPEPISVTDPDPMIDPSLSTPLPQSPQSSFTSELPNDVKTIVGLEMADPLASVLMGDGGELIGSELIGTNYGGPAHPPSQGYSLGPVYPRDMPLPSYESPVEVSSYSDLLKSPPLGNPTETFPAQDNPLDTSNHLSDWNDWINDPYDDAN